MAKQIVFEKDAFVGKVRSDVITLESGVEKYLADIMQKEAKSKVDDSFKNTLAKFKASIDVYSTTISTTSTKVSFPEEVYKVLLAKHVAEYKPPEIKIEPALITEMQNYIADILGSDNETVTTADGDYKVSPKFAKAGLSTVTDNNGRLYTLNWKPDNDYGAKKSLYSLLNNLKTWGQNLPTYLFEQLKTPSIETLFSSWSKALITCKFIDVVSLYNNLRKFAQSYVPEENVSEWTGTYASKWLNDLTKKLFPNTNKEIATLQEKYKKLDDLSKDGVLLKDYKADPDSTADTIKDAITGLTSYKNFIKAYNDLQVAIGQSTINFDSIIPDYIGYEISKVLSGPFSEDNATITCADGNNQIEVNGSNVSVDTGRGNDTIQSGSYSESNSKVKIHAGDGDDEIYNYSSDSTLDGGAGEDFIRSDSKGTNVSISGGDGFDTIDSHGNHNIIDGGAGNDSISNYGDNVTISGDGGADTIRSYGSDSSVFGGAGDDELLVMSSYVDGGTGSDTISIQGSYVTAYGGGSFDYLPTKDVFNIASGASNVYINDFEFGDVLNLPADNYTARIEFGSTAIRNSSGKLIVWLKNFTDRLENFTYDENGKQTSDGDDSINNDVSNIKIDLGAGNDTINNSGNNVSINGGGGNDSISNRGNNVTIDLGDGNDSVYSSNQGYHSTIIGGNGNDCIRNDAQYVMISGDDGDDTISNEHNSVTIDGGNNNDFISSRRGSNAVLTGGYGKDTIWNERSQNVTIDGGDNDDYISNSWGATENLILGGAGDDSIHNGSNNVTVDGGAGNDYIKTSGSNDVREFLSSMSGGNGNDTIIYDGDYYMDTVGTVTILGGDGDDSISNAGRFSTIDGGTGNDTIFNTGKGFSTFSSINGGEGNDIIYSNRASGGWAAGTSIIAGTGDDTIYNSDEIYLAYALGDGNDIIYNSKGYIYVGLSITSGTYGKIISGDDLIFKVGEGSITLKDFGDYERQSITFGELGHVEKFKNANNISLNIYGTEGSITTTLLGSEENDDIFCKPAGYIETFGGDDKIYTSVSGAEIIGGKGNDTISGWNGMNSFLAQYTDGDGDDVIYGFNSTSTLSISGGEYSTQQSGSDIVVTVGEGKILLKGAASLSALNIDGKEEINLITEGTESGERLENSNDNQTILAKGGDDTVKNWGDNVSINAGAGNDTIYSDGENVTILGGSGSDSVTNWGAKTSISGGADNDYLINAADSVTVAGDTGADTVFNQSYNVSINGGTDNDSIQNSGYFVTLTATSGNNFFANLAGYVTVAGGTDSDTVHNQGENVSINTGAGNDSLQNSGSTVKIFLDDGDDKINNFATRVTISGGDGDDSIGNWKDTDNVSLWSGASTDNVSISGGAGNDSIYNNGGNNVTLNGDAGNDTIKNFYATVKINGGNDNDLIYNDATNVTINGGAGSDTVDNGSDNVSINGYTGDDSILNEGSNVTIFGGAGNDTITNKTAVYATVNGKTITVRPDNVSINGGAGNDSIINTGGENVWLGGGQAVSMSGGAGNDTLTGSTQAEIFIYESGNDVITNYSGEDTVKIATGAIDSYYVEDTDLIFNIGSGSLTLKNMQGHYITITDSAGKTTTQLYGSTGYTAQDAIKNLVHSWNKTFLSSNDKLDESIKLSTHFGTIQDAIDQMVADCNAAGDADTFLRKYCGIIMDNADTGAITGWDAGNASIKTADNVMGETVGSVQHVPDYTDTTFTARNLTINIASTGSSLNANGKKTFDGLYSWWADDAIKLVEDSYGFSFSDGDSIRVEMVPTTYSGNTSSSGVVKLNQGNITYNSDDDYNGNGIDRTIAHEFTHVAQNYFMGHFAQFLEEGLADLTPGIDDRGGKSDWIESLAGNADSLASYLDLNKSGTGEVAYYASGYMFYRYLARQAAVNFDSSADYAWKDGILLNGTSDADLLTGSGSNSTLSAGAGNDTVTAYGESMNVLGDDGKDRIYNAGSNSTIAGGAGNDTITNTGENVLFTYAEGDGNDSIVGFDETTTLQIAANNFSTTKSDSNIIVTIGDGKVTLRNAFSLSKLNIFLAQDDTYKTFTDNDATKVTLGADIVVGDATARTLAIRIVGNALDNSIFGGSGKDTLYGKDGNDYLVGNTGNDKLYGQNGNDTLWGGDGNDMLKGGSGNDLFVYTAGNDVITDYAASEKISVNAAITASSVKGSDATFTIGGNTLKVTNGKGQEIVFIDADGNERTIIGGAFVATNSTSAKNTLAAWREVGDATARTTAIKIVGNAQDNSIFGGSGKDTLYGKDGNDYIDGGTGNDKLYGQNGDDTLWGDTGNDTLTGGDGNDTLTGGDGKDLFVYTAGNDVITDYAAGEKISVNAAITASSVKGSDATFTIGGNTLKVTNGKGQEIVFIDADGNERTIIGGAFVATNSTSAKNTLASWREVGDASARTTAIKIVGNAQDNSIFGGTGKDTLYGKDGNDYLVGNAGNDKLYGQVGNDTLYGSAGNDTLTGGEGNDLFIYTAGKDVIADYASGDKISLGAEVSSASLNGANSVLIIGNGKLTVKNTKKLTLIDSDGTELTTIIGSVTLTDSDESKITLGSDVEYVDATARTTAIRIVGNAQDNIIYGGSGNDTLYGKDGNDYIDGGTGNDKLYGQNGDDTLWGSLGNDTLVGGAGADLFIYTAGKDVISGFEDDDLLQISGDWTAAYNESANTIAFKVDSTANALTLKNFTATTFNVGGTAYQISNGEFVKK